MKRCKLFFELGGNPFEKLKLGQHRYTPEEIYRDCQKFYSRVGMIDHVIPSWAWVRLPTQKEIISYLKTKHCILHKK